MHRKRDCWIQTVVTLACAAFLAAACGGGSSATPSGGQPGTGGTGGTGGNGGGGAPVTLVGLQIAPGSPTLVLTAGDAVQLSATERYSDGSTRDRTPAVSWSSSNPAVATVSDAAATKGAALAAAAGTSTISAYDAASGLTASVTVVVTEAVLDTLTITPATPSTPAGYGVQFNVEAVYSDGATSDVTDLATWTSSDVAVATISNDAVTRGLATGVAAGQATITATMPGGKTASTTLEVRAAVLQSLSISAVVSDVPRGVPLQLTATARFSDGATQDVTAFVEWTTSDATVATVSNAAGSAGVLTGVQVGTVTVRAAHGSIVAEKAFGITAATLQGITVSASPGRAFTWLGTSTRFLAQGTFSDQTVLDLSRQVTWTVSPAGLVTFSSVAGKTNVAWAIGATSSPVVVTATDPASGTTGSFTWARIRQRSRTAQ